MAESADTTPHAVSELTGSWTLDPRRTTVAFDTKAMWVIPVHGSFAATEGSAAIDGDGGVVGRLVLDAKSVDTKNAKRDEHLRGADFFDVEKYPAMVFDVTGASLGAAGLNTINGTLTIRDVSHPVELQGAVRTDADGALILDAHTEIDRSEWGVSWAKMGAGLNNKVTITATLVRQQ